MEEITNSWELHIMKYYCITKKNVKLRSSYVVVFRSNEPQGFLEKLTVMQLIRKFRAFNETQSVISVSQ